MLILIWYYFLLKSLLFEFLYGICCPMILILSVGQDNSNQLEAKTKPGCCLCY